MNHYKFLTNSDENSKDTGQVIFFRYGMKNKKTLPFSGKRSDD